MSTNFRYKTHVRLMEATMNLKDQVIEASEIKETKSYYNVTIESSDGAVAAVRCDQMCSECTRTCTRDYCHSGPHRCDLHAR